MSIAQHIMRLASIGLTEDQARVVGEVIVEIERASEAANEVRRASDRDRKRLKKASEPPGKSTEIHGNPKTAAEIQGADASRIRAFSIGEEEVTTSSLRSEAADAASSAAPIFQNAKQELWAVGKDLLGELGIAPTKAGTMIGRWLKETGDDAPAVLDTIRRARQQKPVNPVSWIVRALPQPRAGPPRQAKTNGFLQAAMDLTNEMNGRRDDGPDPETLYLELSANSPAS